MVETQSEILDQILSEESITDSLQQWPNPWLAYEKLKHCIQTLELESGEYEQAIKRLSEALHL